MIGKVRSKLFLIPEAYVANATGLAPVRRRYLIQSEIPAHGPFQIVWELIALPKLCLESAKLRGRKWRNSVAVRRGNERWNRARVTGSAKVWMFRTGV